MNHSPTIPSTPSSPRATGPTPTARPGRGLRIAGCVVAGLLALLMIKWVLMTAFLLAVPFALWWVIDRAGRGRRARARQAAADELAVRRRAEVESRAVVDAAGGCGWCGSRIAHRDHTGRIVLPREHHRADIEHTLTDATTAA